MPMVYRYYEKSRTSAADGISFRGCLSDDGVIFSKSVEHQGGANRTFATGGRCHGWQLEPCPCGLEPLLTFRQKIPTGRPYIEEGHSVRHGRSWICFTNSQFIILLVHTDNAGNFPHDGHSLHDADSVIKCLSFTRSVMTTISAMPSWLRFCTICAMLTSLLPRTPAILASAPARFST